MFRRNNRIFSSISRHSRRAAKSLLRTHRSDAKWMASYRERQSRVARWKSAFSFVPLNLSRFRAFITAMTAMMARLIPSVDMSTKGRKQKSARHGLKLATAMSYENLELRQLLAADLSNLDLISDTGASSSDDITMTALSTFEVDYANALQGETIEIRAGGPVLGSGVVPITTFFGDAAPDATNFSITLTSPLSEGVNTVLAKSAFGGGVEPTLSVTLDTTAPTLTGVAFDDALITDADAGSVTTLTYTFNESLWPGLAGSSSTDQFATFGNAFNPVYSNSDMNYSVDFTVSDANVEVIDVTVSQAGGLLKDVAGNAFGGATSVATTTDIDTLNPTVTISSSKGTGGDVILAGETALLTFDFSEDIEDGSFVVGDISLGGGTGSLSAFTKVTADKYTAVYTPSAGNSGETVTVSVAAMAFMDEALNDNDVGDSIDLDVDTLAPGISSLSLIDTTLSFTEIDEDDIPGTTKLTITFSETMDMGVDPTVTPNGADSQATLTTLPVVSAMWTSATTYEVVYDLTDADVEVGDVTFAVSGAKDDAGNTMAAVAAESSGTSIDTLVEKVTFSINDSMPQEDILPDLTLINSQVTFSVDDEASGTTTITYMIGSGDGTDSATAGVDYKVDGATLKTDMAEDYYEGTVTIIGPATTALLDIDMLPDLIWEGDETFTVKITKVENTTETVMDGSTPAMITIMDNEVGAEVTIMAPDPTASEAFQFEAVDITGAPLFDTDIVANADDATQTAFDSGTYNVYQTESADAGGVLALDDDGFYPENGDHPNIQLTARDSDDGLNARITAQSNTTPDVFTIDVPDNKYSEIHVLGAAAGGSAAVSVRMFYSDGTVAEPSKSYGDWKMAPTADTYDLTGVTDRADDANTATNGSADARIFGAAYTADPTRTLEYVEISVDTSDAANGSDGGDFAFFGATGVAAEGTMGQFAVKLDFAIDEDLTVVLDSSGIAGIGEIGDPADGNTDYYLSVESDPGSGDFNTPLAVAGGKVTVVIEAGDTERLVKLTAKDDMVVEGGINDAAFGSEDATLTIDDRSVPAGPLPDVGTPDSATVDIEDDDAALVTISDVTPGGDIVGEGEDSGVVKVTLNKKNTSVTGMTTSSTDTIVKVGVSGVAKPGLDYQTSITGSGSNTSTGSAQRIDGFWSKQFDPNIQSSTTWAHNTVLAEATGAHKHYYEVVLFSNGKLRLDIDGTVGFNPHVRVLADGASAGADALFGNNRRGSVDPGSTSANDSFLTTGTLAAGRYVIEVSEHTGTNNNTDAKKASKTKNMSAGDSYRLQVSIENHEEGILIPAGEEMSTFNVDPVDDMIVEGGLVANPGSENVKFTLMGVQNQSDPDIMAMGSTELDIIDNDDADLGVTSTMNGHEDPLTTPPGTPEDGKFSVELSKESSTDTKVKFTIVGYNDAAPVAGVEKVGDDATYGIDYTLRLSQAAINDGFTLTVNTSGPMEGMGFLTIPAGEKAVDIIVDVINEDYIEDDEFVRLQFATTSPPNMNDPNIAVDGSVATVTIFDEDLSEVAINGSAFAEEGGQNGVFTVSLDVPKTSDTHTDVEFMVMLSDTTPSADLPPMGDYDISTTLGDVISWDSGTGIGVVRIPAHTGFGEIIVEADDDDLIELTEYIKIKLTGKIGSTIPGSGDSNITDVKPGFESDEIELRDNDKAYVKIANEDDGYEPGAVAMDDGHFRVSLVDSAGDPLMLSYGVTISYATLGSSTASAGAAPDGFNIDYETLPGSVLIPAMTSSVLVTVDVFDDVVNESDETVDVELTGTNSSSVELHPMASMRDATVTIFDDDDVEITIEANDSMAREANDDGQYKITLSTYSDAPVVIDLATVTGSGPNADADEGDDYTLSTSQVTFAPFQTMAWVDLNVINDAILEQSIEQAEVGVYTGNIVSSNPGVTADDSAIVDIKPDPTVSISAYDMMGTEGADDASFIVELPKISGGPMDGQYNLADDDLVVTYVVRGTAENGVDYDMLSGTVTIPQADGYAHIDVDITDDMIIEGTELVSVMLKSVTADDINDSDVRIERDLYSVSPEDNLLRAINVDVADSIADGTTELDRTVPITLEGDTVLGGYGLAVDHTTHELYAVVSTSGSGSRALVTVDPATGHAELVGALSGDFRGIDFDAAGNLRGLEDDGTLWAINKATGAQSSPVSLATTSDTDGLGYNPDDGDFYHYSGDGLGTNVFAGVSNGPVSTTYDTTAGGVLSGASLEHYDHGNFDGNGFFLGETHPVPVLWKVDFDDSTMALDATTTFVAYTDHAMEGLAFNKSNAFVKIKDNDSGFIEVKAKDKGDDSLDASVNTGFNLTIRKPDGTTATTSSTDTTVKFMLMDTATRFLGDQTENSSSATGQDIDTFNGSTGGADHWSPNGSGVPHTIVNGSGSGPDYYTFTVLNDGDMIDLSSVGSSSSMVLSNSSGVVGSGAAISVAGVAGEYTIQVTGNGGAYTLNVAVENHLIADYALVGATDLGGGMWEATIPADQSSIMVTVDVFDDTQVEDIEDVSLWLKSVTSGDPDISTGLVYFADDRGPAGSVGRGDVGGLVVENVINNLPPGVDPIGLSIDAAEGKVYWSSGNSGDEGIFRANLDGSDFETVVLTDSGTNPAGIEVAGDYVYWVDASTDEVRRMMKDGSGTIENIVDVPEDASVLRDIAVDEASGKVYFSDEGLNRILRVNVNGTNLETIIVTGGDPSGLALDLVNGKIYWADDDVPGPVVDGIRRANLDGSDIELVANVGSDFNSRSGLAVDTLNNYVYFSDDDDDVKRVPLGGGLPAAAELVFDTDVLPGIQTLGHIDLLIPTMIHATAQICDNDTAEVYVSSDNTLAEASVDPASEDPLKHKDIVLSLRDANGTPVTVQTSTTIDYTYKAESTATNGSDFAFLDGTTVIPAGVSSAIVDGPMDPTVFVFNDSLLEGDETAIIGLDAATGDPDVTIVAPNALDEDMGFVLIKDDETATVSVEATDEIAKEADGTQNDPLDGGKFTFTLTDPSSSDTTVFFEVLGSSTASSSDFSLSAMAGANLQDLGGGKYSVDILANEFTAMVFVDVVQDELVENNETVNIEIYDVTSATNALISVGTPDGDTVTIYDDDVAKIIIENVMDATEPNTNGQFKVSMVDLSGTPIESQTTTLFRVLVDPSSTATYGADYVLPGFSYNAGLGTWFKVFQFNPGDTMETIDVNLLPETPPLDMGDEFVKLKLDPTYVPGPSGGDGVVGDPQIKLDVMDGSYINYTFVAESPCYPGFSEPGMGMNMDSVTIFDERFKINIEATDQNASEPGTLPLQPGDNGQFTVSITNPWMFGDTIVNYVITGLTTNVYGDATTADKATGPTNPADYSDLVGYDPSNLDYQAVSIHGQVTIPMGATSTVIDVLVLDDEVIEWDPETVEVTLTGLDDESTTGIPGSGSVENVPMIGVRMLGSNLTDHVNIFDDDSAVATAKSIKDGTEPDSPGDNGQFEVSLLEGGTPIISDTDTTIKFEIGGDAKLGGPGASDFSGPDYKLVLDVSTDASEGFMMSYSAGSGIGFLKIPAGYSTAKINVVTLDDYIIEADEDVTLTPTDITAGDDDITASGVTETVTIEDTDDGVLKLVTLDGMGTEPGGLNPDATYRVYLVDADDTSQRLVSDSDTDVTYEVKASSTATPDADYVALSGSVTIDAFTGMVPDFTLGSGDGEALIEVHVLDDLEVEPTETVDVEATAADDVDSVRTIDVSATMFMGSVDIFDNDTALVSIKSDSANADDDVQEGNPGPANNGKFEVLMDKISATPTVVTYMFDAGSSTAKYGGGAGDDFTLSTTTGTGATGTVVIPAGQQSATIDLITTNDLTQEALENVVVKVTGTNNGAIGVDGTMDSASIDIQDDDLPTFIVYNTMASESTGSMKYTIELTDPIDVDVEVFLNLSDGTATGISGSGFDATSHLEDYNNDNTTIVTFPANGTGSDLIRMITIDVNNDNWVEKDETFTAELVVNGASLPNMLPDGRAINVLDANDPGYGVATIKNDDTATFTIFEKGSSTNSDPMVMEGTDGTPYNGPYTPVNFQVELSNPIDAAVDVDVDFAGNGAFPALGGTFAGMSNPTFPTDFDNKTQTVTFAVGDYGVAGRQDVTVNVVKDQIVEGGPTLSFGSETFLASLTPDAGDLMMRPAVATDTSTATIKDDDSATVNVMSMDDEASEDDHTPSFGDASYTITQTNPSGSDTVVKFQMSGDADLGDDYTLSAPGANSLTDLGGGMFEVTIPAGDTSVEITLSAVSDPALIEDDEFATMTLVDLVAHDKDITIDSSKDSDTVRINDGDSGKVKISSDPADGGIPMGMEGSMDGKFVFLLNDDSGAAVSDSDTIVKFEISGDATPGVDYTISGADLVSVDYGAKEGFVLIKAGDSMAMVDIEVINDTETEDNETVTLTVVSASTPGNADIVPDVDMDTDDVIIKDDGDGLFVHVMKQQDGSEPGFDDADDGLFKIFLTDANGDPAVVPAGSTLSGFLQIKYTIGKPGDTATEGADFKSLADTVSIAEGASSALVSIEVLDDNEIEGTEFISIKIDDVQDSDGTPITTLGTGEEIGIDSAWMMDSLDILDDDSSFEVTSVKVGSSSWTSTFNSVVDPVDGQGYAIPTGGTVQNDTVSWVDIDTIYVSFNDDIDVATMVPANFVLHGLQGASTPSVLAVTWDAGTKTAKLSLSGAIINDKLRVEVKDAVKNTSGDSLNGEFVNDSDSLPGTGDDFTGGDFNFTFNVLPGDATHSTVPALARTNVGDAALVYGSLAAFPFGYPTTMASMFYDVNGNGVVNVGDAAAIFGLLSGSPFGFGLPVGSPGGFAGGSFSLSTGIVFDNGVQTDWSQPQDDRSELQGSRTSGASTTDRSLAGSIVDDSVNSALDSVFGDEFETVSDGSADSNGSKSIGMDSLLDDPSTDLLF